MKREGLVWIAGILIALFSFSSSYAQSPQVTAGLEYLYSTQNPDGSWGGEVAGVEVLPSTVSVIETLRALNQTNSSSYSNALTWLQSKGLETTDDLAERIHALSVAGNDKDLLLSYLDELEYAWGGHEGFEVNNLDTTYALLALKQINHSDLQTINYALMYLTVNQNADGGWGFYPSTLLAGAGQEDESSVYMTANVLQSMIAYDGMFDVQDSQDKAIAYLFTKQNVDGGFGMGGATPPLQTTTSTIYETALVVIAMINSGVSDQQSATSIQNGINYLESTQLPNGSWDNDPYSTALALRALTSVKPNLTISGSDISFSTSTPTVGETITIAVTIRNTGSAPSGNVVIQFFDGNPETGGVLIGETMLQFVASSESAQASISWFVPTSSAHKIYVSVDPQNLIEETDEADNMASKT